MKLTQEEKRIKIAEACGWTFVPSHDEEINGLLQAVPEYWKSEYDDRPIYHSIFLPDYFGDLNKVHEVERMLSDDQQRKFAKFLYYMPLVGVLVDSDGSEDWETVFQIAHSTSEQRAEAFGLTLNLWTPEQ